jgi:gliding motility-associated-like protein
MQQMFYLTGRAPWLSLLSKSFWLLFFCALSGQIFAQNAFVNEWALRLGSNGADRVYAVAADGAGNVYVAGEFNGTVDFNPNPNVTNNLTSNGGVDGFVAKYDASGNYLWAFNIGGEGNDFVYSLVVNSAGEVHIGGSFSGTVDFDPGAGTTNRSSNNPDGSNAFVAKYTTAGALTWVRSFGGGGTVQAGAPPFVFLIPSTSKALALALDASDNVLVTGQIQGTNIDYGNGTPVNTVGRSDLFLASYAAADGAHRWSFNTGGAGSDINNNSQGLDVYFRGTSVFLTGEFKGAAVNFNPLGGIGNERNLASTNNDRSAAFFARYNPADGILVDNDKAFAIPATTANPNSGTFGTAILGDAAGNTYVAGHLFGEADFDLGAGTETRISGDFAGMFLAKYTITGAYEWVAFTTGNSIDKIAALAFDPLDDIHVYGSTLSTTLNFSSAVGAPNTQTVTRTSEQDLFYAKYNAAGSLLNAQTVAQGGTGNRNTDNNIATSIGASPAARTMMLRGNKIYFAGAFNNTANFGKNSCERNLTSAGNADGFVLQHSLVRLNQTITFGLGADATKPASAPAFTLTASSTSCLPITFSSSNAAVATVSGNTVTIVGQGTTTITASQAGNDHFNPATAVDQVLTVTPATQTITFNALANRCVLDAPFTLNATASSGLAVSYASSNTAVATVSGNTITIVGIGTTTITASQAGNAQFAPADNVAQTLTITRCDQTVTFEAIPDKFITDEPFTITATASSGLPITFSSSTPDIVTVSGNTVTIVGSGTATIVARQAGNEQYNPAEATRSFQVSLDDRLRMTDVFTPNGDGRNDNYNVIFQFDPSRLSYRILDLNNNVVYETNNVNEARNNGWDGTINGKPAPGGRYIWFVEYTRANGSTARERGFVLLAR